jgi:hypothetical protein
MKVILKTTFNFPLSTFNFIKVKVYVERKANGRILYCKLTYFKIGDNDTFLRFEGNERDANAWLAWLYDTNYTGPNFYANDYWQEQAIACLEDF